MPPQTIPNSVSCPTRLYSTMETEMSTYPSCTQTESEGPGFIPPESANDNLCPSDPKSPYAVQLFVQEATKRIAEDSATKIEGKVQVEEEHSTAGCLVRGIYYIIGSIGFVYNFLT